MKALDRDVAEEFQSEMKLLAPGPARSRGRDGVAQLRLGPFDCVFDEIRKRQRDEQANVWW